MPERSIPAVTYCCPRCHGPLVGQDPLRCETGCGAGPFPVVSNQPVLIDFENSILERQSFVERRGSSAIPRRNWGLVRRLKGTNRVAARIAADLLTRLGQRGARVLVIGGGAIGSGAEALYTATGIELVGTDIYATPNTRVIADGHQLPFPDGSFDAVWIQAVLEHVLDPAQVAQEIHRVLAVGGLVYADTPFMQQVHEGPYDFTRFTLNGHRWLFRRFDEIESGATNGAGTTLIWAIQYFLRAITGSPAIGRAALGLFFWLRFFDGKTRAHEDGASGTYFYGRKSAGSLRPADIVANYVKRV